MTTYYVDYLDGNDGNAGTSEGSGNAWKTITHAAANIVADDLIYVKASADYAENTTFTVQGSSNGSTKVAWIGYDTVPGDNGIVNVTGSGVGNTWACAYTAGFSNVWCNFSLSNSAGSGFLGANTDSCMFINCKFNNNTNAGIQIQSNCAFIHCEASGNGSWGLQSTNGRYFDCLIQNNTQDGIRSSCLWAINNVVTKNGNAGASSLQVSGITGGMGYGNTIDGEGSGGNTMGFDGTISQFTLLKNIVVNCDTAFDIGQYSAAYSPIMNNLTFNATTVIDRGIYAAWPYDDIKNVSGNPAFTDAGADDYSLQSSSPAVDAGLEPGPY
jgi:hypothetical protein